MRPMFMTFVTFYLLMPPLQDEAHLQLPSRCAYLLLPAAQGAHVCSFPAGAHTCCYRPLRGRIFAVPSRCAYLLLPAAQGGSARCCL